LIERIVSIAHEFQNDKISLKIYTLLGKNGLIKTLNMREREREREGGGERETLSENI
jgi:hypothetical protein